MKKKYDNPVVILAGGLGTRLREETQFRPKPMVPVGGRPILWHIMKYYAHFGFYRFVICLGYKGEMIKDYFLQYRLQGVDITINTKSGSIIEHQVNDEEWEVTLVNTGLTNQTGSRVAQISHYIDTDEFLLTYGDGICNANIAKLFDFHKGHGKMATLLGVSPLPRFGNLQIENSRVSNFLEKKPFEAEWVNGGFFVLNRAVFDYCSAAPETVFEKDILPVLAVDGQLMVYKHDNFWHCMDTMRDQEHLEELWQANKAPWKVWNDEHIFKPAKKISAFIKGKPSDQVTSF